MKKEVLGVKIDDLSIAEITSIVATWLKNKDKHYIVTPNPEIVMMAQQDPELKEIINQADLAIPDGNGLKIGSDIVCNSPGIDVLEALVKMAADYGLTTGFLGGTKGIAEKTADCLQKKYPKLKVSFANEELGKMPATDFLFVAFGAPKQEKWINNNLKKLDVKVMMGVGGSLDYLSGRVPRAPKIIRKLGLEWLFRLMVQPWRIKRQLALIKYLFMVLFNHDHH